MKEFKGRLEYLSLFKPVMVGNVDLRESLYTLLSKLNGQKTRMDYTMNSFALVQDETSDREIQYENTNEGILILLKDKSGWSNVIAYITGQLERLNGRAVVVNVSSNSISIDDAGEEVLDLNYTDGNSCAISIDNVKKHCQPGTESCCIFLTAGSNGFMCEKFGSTGTMMLGRHANGEMRANRIGGCRIVGRIEK